MSYRPPFAFLLHFVCYSLLASNAVIAAEYRIGPDTDVEPICKQIRAGDSLVLNDGLWSDAELKFERLPGTTDAPIHIRAQTPGRVVFSGATEFRLSGQNVVVSGFVFRDVSGASDVVQLRSHSERHAHHCRFTDCVFEQTSDAEVGIESRWLSIYGTKNRIDHCCFTGKRNRGPTMVVWVSKDVAGAHRIDHNYFGPRPELGKNGGETIRIGTSEVSESNSGTVVEENYFHQCSGESEIISNKACGNIYRHNVFDECGGALTLRHGHRCLVDGNAFLGRTTRGTGGVRIIGQGHTVTNNYFEGLRGDAERAAICVMNGIPNGSLNSYAPVREAVVAHNTFIDCKVTLELGYRGGRKQSAAPTDCRFTHNLFIPDKWPLFRVHVEPVAAVWEGNKHQVGRDHEGQFVEFERIDLALERGEDGLLRAATSKSLQTKSKSAVPNDIDGEPRGDVALAGCDVPGSLTRKWASARTTGPTWKSTSD